MDLRVMHQLNARPRKLSLDPSNLDDDDDDRSVLSEASGERRRRGFHRLLSLNREDNSGNEYHHDSRRSSLSIMVGKGVKNTLMAPVAASRFAVNVGVKSTQAVANATVKSTQAVANATVKSTQAVANVTVKSTQAVAHATTKTVMAGAKGVVGGGKALMDGTGAVVGYGGKTVLSGAKGVVKITKAPWKSFTKGRTQSKWERGIACIESLLDTDSATYQAMTSEQREQLAKVKKLLVKGAATNSNLHQATEAEKMAYVPMELLKDKKTLRKSSVTSKSNGDPSDAKNFILQEFAGVRNETVLQNLGDETSDDGTSTLSNDDDGSVMELADDESTFLDEKPSAPKPQVPKPLKKRRKQSFGEMELMFVPPEFSNLSSATKGQVCDMLSWESISTWGYDIFTLDDITDGNALLFISWAVVAYPHAQNAMAKACEKRPKENLGTSNGYSFVEDFGIVPSTLCNYVRAVQAEYRSENPYHNSIHAADVVQTLHALIQMRGVNSSDPLDVLSILLAAIVHDQGHPGNTNGFHTNLRTELAVMYNDASVLENWHVARAFACMLNLTLEEASSQNYEILAAPNRRTERNILSNVDKDDFTRIRNRVIEAVLHTDMTKHFAMVNAAKGLLLETENGCDETLESSWKIFMFMLHMADISSQAKPDPLFRHWTVRCMDEFFDQGELEEKFGLPISPNCNRDATNIAESQVGFMKFVVGPAYDVLSGFIPALEVEVLPIIEANLNVWINES